MTWGKHILRTGRSTEATIVSLGIAGFRLSHGFYRLPSPSHLPVIVMGNGPSSRETIEAVLLHRDCFQVACVNDFYKSELFSVLRPDFYIIADPMYWLPETSKMYQRPLVDGLRSADWKMNFFFPREATDAFQRSFSSTLNITLYPYNRSPVEGFSWIIRNLYWFGLGMPRPQNVLIPALFVLLRTGFRQLYLGGAEHLWHQALHLSSDNVLHVVHGSGGADSSKLVPFYKIEGRELFTVPEIFEAWAIAHRGYHELNAWAGHLGARIENVTPCTFIDAFPRVSIRAAVERVRETLQGNG